MHFKSAQHCVLSCTQTRHKHTSHDDSVQKDATNSKKCNCGARLLLHLPTTYARELGLTKLGGASRGDSAGRCAREPPSDAGIPAPTEPLPLITAALTGPPTLPLLTAASMGALTAPAVASTLSTMAAGVQPSLLALPAQAAAGLGTAGANVSASEYPGSQQLRTRPDTTIHIRLHLTHTGHTPGSEADLKRQPAHPAVAAKAVELVRQGVPYLLLQEQLSAFADQLVETLGVARNEADCRFFPRKETIRNLYDSVIRKLRFQQVGMCTESERLEAETNHGEAVPVDREEEDCLGNEDAAAFCNDQEWGGPTDATLTATLATDELYELQRGACRELLKALYDTTYNGRPSYILELLSRLQALVNGALTEQSSRNSAFLEGGVLAAQKKRKLTPSSPAPTPAWRSQPPMPRPAFTASDMVSVTWPC